MKKINLSPYDETNIKAYGESVLKIVDVACKYYGISHEKIGEHRKLRIPTRARHLVMLLSKELIKGCPLYTIGYLINPDFPFDHATTRHAIQVTEYAIKEKTALGRYKNPEIRNDHQILRGQVVYELGKIGVIPETYSEEKMHTRINKELSARLNTHCKNTGITKALFLRTAVINELNRIQNGV